MNRDCAAGRPSLDDWLGRQIRAYALTRRNVLGGLGGLALAGCSSGGAPSSANGSTSSSGGAGTGGAGTGGSATGGAASASCTLIPEETVGPYPLFNDIASAAIYQRDDITEGKPGVPLRSTLTIVNVNNACAPVTTAMVYVWHCDEDGYYSGHNQSGADTRGQTFCRAGRPSGPTRARARAREPASETGR